MRYITQCFLNRYKRLGFYFKCEGWEVSHRRVLKGRRGTLLTFEGPVAAMLRLACGGAEAEAGSEPLPH